MICKKYSDLSPYEKIMFIGKLTHACMNDDTYYEMGKEIIDWATTDGLFENVIIMPENKNNQDDTQI